MNNITHLVTFGCSFTEGSELGNKLFGFDESITPCSHRGNASEAHVDYMQRHAWPAVLAGLMGAKVLNYGKCGDGNTEIAETMAAQLPIITARINPANILVIPMWTDMSRIIPYIRMRHMLIIPRYSTDNIHQFGSIHDLPTDGVSKGLMVGINNYLVDHWCDINNTVRDALHARHYGELICARLGCRVVHAHAMWEDPAWYGSEATEWRHGHCNANLEQYHNSISFGEDTIPLGNNVADFLNNTVHSFGGYTTAKGYAYGTGGHPLEEAHAAYAHWVFSQL